MDLTDEHVVSIVIRISSVMDVAIFDIYFSQSLLQLIFTTSVRMDSIILTSIETNISDSISICALYENNILNGKCIVVAILSLPK